MTSNHSDKELDQHRGKWTGCILSLVAILTVVYLIAANWAAGFRLGSWQPWNSTFFFWLPLVQILLLVVLVVAVVRRIRHRRTPLLPLAAAMLIPISWWYLTPWSRELGRQQLSAEITLRDVADECFRLIHSSAEPVRESITMGRSGIPTEYRAIRRLNPNRVLYTTTGAPLGESEKQPGDVIIMLTPAVAYTFYYSEESSAWVLVEAYRESAGSKLLVKLPTSTRPASQPEQQTRRNGD